MYSHEISKYLEDRNYCITPQEFIWLVHKSGSTQIDHVKYDAQSDIYHMWTTDEADWKFSVSNS